MLISLTFYKYYTKNSGRNRILGGVKFWVRMSVWYHKENRRLRERWIYWKYKMQM